MLSHLEDLVQQVHGPRQIMRIVVSEHDAYKPDGAVKLWDETGFVRGSWCQRSIHSRLGGHNEAILPFVLRVQLFCLSDHDITILTQFVFRHQLLPGSRDLLDV
jgi:hypothetical protein